MASKARGTSQRPALRYVQDVELVAASTVEIHGSNAARWFQNHTDAMMGLWNLKTFLKVKKVLSTPWKINGWNLQITHLERKMIFQTSMIMFHVNLPGCINEILD